MIKNIKNTSLDNEKLSYIFIPKGPNLDNFDFSKFVVKKPWGFEYLLYDDKRSSAWVLHLNKGSLTSMHCHIYKKTALVVLSGEVVCATLNGGFSLKEGDGLILDKKVFHSTQVIGDKPVVLLEVEVPSRKADVVRLADSYGRETSGYEYPDEINYDLRKPEFKYFSSQEINIPKKVGNMQISIQNLDEGTAISSTNDLIVILNGETKDELKKQSFFGGDMILGSLGDFYVQKPSKILKISRCPSLKAVLFDFDGVLADTMEDNYIAWKKTCAEYGVDLEREDYFPFEGIQLSTIAKMICDKYNIRNVSSEEIVNKKEEYYKTGRPARFYPGVEEIIDALKDKSILIAVVSAARRERLLSSVPADFLKKFDAVVTGDQLSKGKPYPDPYLEAMKILNVSSDESIVIENAPAGIESAKASGCSCIAISSTMDKKFLKSAEIIIDNFSQLKDSEPLKFIFSSPNISAP